MSIKVSNFKNKNGNSVKNQFIIVEKDTNRFYKKEIFQSYDKIIAIKVYDKLSGIKILLDKNYWDFSKTTGKYRNIFLAENKKETEKKIKKRIYKLTNLN